MIGTFWRRPSKSDGRPAEAKHVNLDYLPSEGIPPKRGEGVVSLRDVMGQVGEAYTLHIGEPEPANI